MDDGRCDGAEIAHADRTAADFVFRCVLAKIRKCALLGSCRFDVQTLGECNHYGHRELGQRFGIGNAYDGTHRRFVNERSRDVAMLELLFAETCG